MEKYFKIFFKKDDKLAVSKYTQFTKKQVYHIFDKAYRTNNASFRYEKERHNFIYQYYKLKRNNHTMYIELIIHKEDEYLLKLKKLRNLYKRRKRVLKKLFALLGLSAILVSVIPVLEKEVLENQILENLDDQFLDDFFTTYLEENDKKSSYRIVENFENEDWITYNEMIYHSAKEEVKNFKIEETVEKTVGSIVLQNTEHSVILPIYYDSEKNNFKKEMLLSRIQDNSRYLKSVKTEKYELLTEEEYSVLIDQLYKYIEVLKEKYLSVDVKHFICNLWNMSFFKDMTASSINQGSYAYFFPWYIVWNASSETFTSLESYIKINFHEFSHINQSYCPCECRENILISGNSVLLYNQSLFEEKVFQLQPYYFTFMLEAVAEKQASDMFLENASTYLLEGEVMDNIEFSLSIHPDYKMGTLMDSSVYRNPLLLYQSFPYIYDEKEELVDYLEMLECYDYCFINDLDNYLKIHSISNENILRDNQAIPTSTSFSYYSRVKHIELFYKNLFYLNEFSQENLIEYDMFLIHLFEDLMRKQEENSYYKNPYLETTLFEGKEIFINYLKEKYPMYSGNELLSIYSNIELTTFNQYPSFIEEEKREFLNERMKSLHVDIYEQASQLIKD